MSPAAEAAVCLQAYGIDDYDGAVEGGIRARGISNNNGCFGRGKGKNNASKGSESTTEAARAQQRYQGIYGVYKGVGRVK